jgi:hypothetical protein
MKDTNNTIWIKEKDFIQEVTFNKEFLSLVLFKNKLSIPDNLAKQFTERIINSLFTKTL